MALWTARSRWVVSWRTCSALTWAPLSWCSTRAAVAYGQLASTSAHACAKAGVTCPRPSRARRQTPLRRAKAPLPSVTPLPAQFQAHASKARQHPAAHHPLAVTLQTAAVRTGVVRLFVAPHRLHQRLPHRLPPRVLHRLLPPRDARDGVQLDCDEYATLHPRPSSLSVRYDLTRGAASFLPFNPRFLMGPVRERMAVSRWTPASCTKPSGHARYCRRGSPMQADGRLRNRTGRAMRAGEKLLLTRFEPQRLIGIERADTGMKPVRSCHPYSGPSAAMPCLYRATSCCARSMT